MQARPPGSGVTETVLSVLRPRLRRWGFTLIELLVVVVLISVLGAVVAPALLSRLTDEAQAVATPSEPLSQAPPSAAAARDSTGRKARQPVFEASLVELDVSASHALEGFGVFTRYDAAYRGTFVVRNMDAVTDTITLGFPFPQGINEVRDVSFRLGEADGGLSEAPGVQYDLEGIECINGDVLVLSDSRDAVASGDTP